MRLKLLFALLLSSCVLLAALAAPGAAARDPDVSASIHGGTVDRQRNVGWISAVMRHPSTSPEDRYERQFCAGSLVAPDWVLTAAHCVVDEGTVTAPGALQILVGTKHLLSGGQESDVTEVHVCPHYVERTSACDAALLRLATNVSVATVRVARPGQRTLYEVGRRAYIAGWGDRRADDDPQSSFPEVLYSAFVPIRSSRVCRRDWGGRFTRTYMFCAGNDRGRPDTCRADSGGPIAIRLSGSRWRLIGITSFGRCGVPGNIGVYTLLRSQRISDWIDGTIPD
jgi:secreted trypsin-like serine protease